MHRGSTSFMSDFHSENLICTTCKVKKNNYFWSITPLSMLSDMNRHQEAKKRSYRAHTSGIFNANASMSFVLKHMFQLNLKGYLIVFKRNCNILTLSCLLLGKATKVTLVSHPSHLGQPKLTGLHHSGGTRTAFRLCDFQSWQNARLFRLTWSHFAVHIM